MPASRPVVTTVRWLVRSLPVVGLVVGAVLSGWLGAVVGLVAGYALAVAAGFVLGATVPGFGGGQKGASARR